MSPSEVGVSSSLTHPKHRSVCHSPRTYGGMLALFVVGYLLWQPLVAAILPRLTGGPRLQGAAGWQVFVIILPILGAIGGSLWWLGAQRKPGWTGNWLRSTARMLALSTMLMAARIGATPIVIWLAVTLSTAALMGLLFGWTERWDGTLNREAPPA